MSICLKAFCRDAIIPTVSRGGCAARNGIIWVKKMKQLMTVLCLVCAAPAFALARIEVSALPASECADTEVSTNVVFRTSRRGVRTFDVRIAYTGSASNCVEVAFGRDADGNGDLSAEEMRLLLGWRGGRRFVEDVAADERIYEDAVPASGRRFLALSVRTDGNLAPRTAEFTCESGPCFASLAAHPPRFICDSSWNLVKVVRRGASAADEWCEIRGAGPVFSVKVR